MSENNINDESEILLKKFHEMYPKVDEKLTPIPKNWNVEDKYKNLWLSNQYLRIHYKGISKSRHESGCIRTKHYIPSTCGIYYFEITIINISVHSTISIGLCTRDAKLNRLPGWQKYSYGYYNENGDKFHGSNNGIKYGPAYTIDDIIGCCINFIDNSCFFTKNGENLGIAFYNLPEYLYPTVGLQTIGDIIDTNFGHKNFFYNIDFVKNELKESIKNSIMNFPICEPLRIYRIVLKYLIHHGFIKTALALKKYTKQDIESIEDFESINNRLNIMKSMREGNIDKVINEINEKYPKLFINRSDILFKLKCRKFIELINNNSIEINNDLQLNKNIENNNYFLNNNLEEKQSILKELLNLGKEIYNFNKEFNSTDIGTMLNNYMLNTFSLLAYEDPHTSCMNKLLNTVQRETLCSELNSTIFEYINRQPISSIDLAPNMAQDLLKLLTESKYPKAVFVDIKDYL